MSRVGGGGYAENRGGFGDRTGGGMSGNARDGLGGSGRGGDHNFAAERARLRAAGADTITPKYSWDQARISDFGITGGLMNGLRGILNSNTYAGRMPQGLQAGYSADGNRVGRPARPLSAQQMFMPQQAAAPPPVVLRPPTSVSGMFMNTGGEYGAGAYRPGYSFFGPGSY